jgi:hypothetical protein
MTSCTQPGCTGTILDGYCDVCGSPAGAPLFALAEASTSAGSPTAAGEPRHTAVRRGAEVSREPKNAGLNTACTQPGCTGTIVDAYCDVCGSPAGAAPFVPSAAAVASPVPADEPGLRAVPATTPAPDPDEQERPTQRIPRVKVPTQQLSTDEIAGPGAADPSAIEEEMPTQRIPRVKVPTQQLSTEEMADSGDADHPALDAQKAHGENELAEEQSDGAQDYQTRVEEVELPDVRNAALRDVGKLERTRDQSPDSGDVWIELDAIAELPWNTETTDWIDIQGAREVEATLRRLIEPAAGDLEEGDAVEVEPAVADVEQGDAAEVEAVVGEVEQGVAAEVEAVVAEVEEGDTAEVEAVVAEVEVQPAVDKVEEGDTAEVEAVVGEVRQGDAAEVEAVGDGDEGDTAEVEAVVGDVAANTEKTDRAPAVPHDDDTVETPAVPAGFSELRHAHPQLPEQQVVEPVVETPAEKSRSRSLALAAIALLLLIGALFFAVRRDDSVTAGSVPTATATATATVSRSTPEPSDDESTDSGGEEATIQVEGLAASAGPFQTVPVNGTYRGGANILLRVQHREGGQWVDFPLPTKTDQSGRFTAYVEFGQPGRYRLRVLDPDSGVTSKPFLLVIKG